MAMRAATPNTMSRIGPRAMPSDTAAASSAAAPASVAAVNASLIPVAVFHTAPSPDMAVPAPVSAGPYFWPIWAAESSNFVLRASIFPVNVSAAAAACPFSLSPNNWVFDAAAWVLLTTVVCMSASFLWASVATWAVVVTFCSASRKGDLLGGGQLGFAGQLGVHVGEMLFRGGRSGVGRGR